MKIADVPRHLSAMSRGLEAMRDEFDRHLARANARLLDVATESEVRRPEFIPGMMEPNERPNAQWMWAPICD